MINIILLYEILNSFNVDFLIGKSKLFYSFKLLVIKEFFQLHEMLQLIRIKRT